MATELARRASSPPHVPRRPPVAILNAARPGRRRQSVVRTTKAKPAGPSAAVDRFIEAGLPGMVWLGDANGRRTFFSARWLTLTGRPESHESGHGWLKGLSPA